MSSDAKLRKRDFDVAAFIDKIALHRPSVVAFNGRLAASAVAKHLGKSVPTLAAEWTIGDALGTASPGTIDHFLVERYALYVSRAGLIFRARVRHPPYALHRASIGHLSETLLHAAGIPAPSEAPLLHASPGVEVDIFPPHRARARAS